MVSGRKGERKMEKKKAEQNVHEWLTKGLGRSGATTKVFRGGDQAQFPWQQMETD